MSQRNSPETYKELLLLLVEFLNEPEEETPEEIGRQLRDIGYDPNVVVTRMRLRIKQAMDASPLNWRNRTEQIREERSRLDKLANSLSGDLEQLKSEINRLLSLLGANKELALHHRNLNLEELGEADLAQLRAELEFQLAQRRNPPGKDKDL